MNSTGEEVPHASVHIKAGTTIKDTANDGQKVDGRNVWWALFTSVDNVDGGDGPFTLDVTSSSGSNPTKSKLTFTN